MSTMEAARSGTVDARSRGHDGDFGLGVAVTRLMARIRSHD
jgi:hypothetical protein